VLTLLFPGASSHIYPFAHAFRVKHSDELYSFSVPTTSAAPIHSYRNLRGLSSPSVARRAIPTLLLHCNSVASTLARSVPEGIYWFAGVCSQAR
jgi:hypothetical protein